MRARFDSAKQLYAYQFLPVIQQTNGTNTPEKCQRLRPNHPARIGCSNCPERACRADNRLVKTMLIASLVPERPVFKDVTASKLVQLNHGSLRAPIPGTEVNLVAQKLRNWASSGTIAQLHVGPQNDPTVRLQLEGVDPGPILEQARQFDTPGARQKVLRDLLFLALGIEGVQDWGKDHVIKNWRGTDRLGHLRFGNVRRLTDEQLMCPPGHDWRLIVDYPFDDEGFGPHDDEKALEKFLEGHSAGTWTIVWLPTFFSKDMQRVLPHRPTRQVARREPHPKGRPLGGRVPAVGPRRRRRVRPLRARADREGRGVGSTGTKAAAPRGGVGRFPHERDSCSRKSPDTSGGEDRG